MSDLDNHMGLFMGSVDSNGKMDTKGRKDDDEKRFVVNFRTG